MPLQRQMHVIRSTSTDSHGPIGNGRENHLRVAFATSNLDDVDEHFGTATRLAIFDVGPKSSHLTDVAEFSDVSKDGNEKKLAPKFQALERCNAVFSLAVGASAVRQLVAQGIQPIKLSETSQIASVLNYLEDEIREGDAPWIKRALQQTARNADERVESLLDEDWDE